MKYKKSIIGGIGSIVLMSSSILLSAPLFAAADSAGKLNDSDRTKHEATGIISGAVIGGVLGGPVGAILTAAFGGWVSDKTIAKKENAFLSEELIQQKQELLALQADYHALEARYQVAEHESQTMRYRNTSVDAQSLSIKEQDAFTECCNDTEISLHFKTNSTAIEPLYDEKLSEFVSLVNSMPSAVIGITGHADRRGDSTINLALSQRRIQALETYLKTLGMKNRSIQTNAFGENRPLSQSDSLEDNFFDRRVVIKIVSSGKSLLTRNREQAANR